MVLQNRDHRSSVLCPQSDGCQWLGGDLAVSLWCPHLDILLLQALIFQLVSSGSACSGSGPRPMAGRAVLDSQKWGRVSILQPLVRWGERKVFKSQENECSTRKRKCR